MNDDTLKLIFAIRVLRHRLVVLNSDVFTYVHGEWELQFVMELDTLVGCHIKVDSSQLNDESVRKCVQVSLFCTRADFHATALALQSTDDLLIDELVEAFVDILVVPDAQQNTFELLHAMSIVITSLASDCDDSTPSKYIVKQISEAVAFK